MAIVNLQDLQVTFGAKTAVSAASFRVDAGETFSLIGASGCGKSTILRVLAGLQREWRGSVDLLGQAITPGARFQGELRRNVQMVFQDPYASLHPNHTLWRTLAEPLQIHGIRDVAPRVTTALEQVGLAPTPRAAIRISSPAVNGSAWPLPAPCCCARRSCCWMSRPRHWICRYRRKSSICLTA